ncbi:MAG: transcription elongation factor GreA [Endomicrobiia bacterium]|nr:transcription elongation factor GreA [Endomicrobiia bacterium]
MKHSYLTKEGFAKLSAEYDELKKRRPQLVMHLEEARQMGDLRENAEYHSTKESLAKLDKRTFNLGEKLKTARVIDKSKIAADGKILLGSTVTLKNLDSGAQLIYQLVDPEEIDIDAGKISVASPIGDGLLEKRSGDAVEIKVPAGLLKLKILKVE